jgi:hypothetical protein
LRICISAALAVASAALCYFLMGLFKKLAIADRMALFADPVFADPGQFGSHAVWVATLAYALQIYCDFSGYTDIAIGCARLLGIRFPKNFDAPYKATNIQDFWRRWHISLSSWLRDYLYVPLGGNRVLVEAGGRKIGDELPHDARHQVAEVVGRKAHERYMQEREWQRLLAEKDAAETVQDASTMWGVAGQATSGPGGGGQ